MELIHVRSSNALAVRCTVSVQVNWLYLFCWPVIWLYCANSVKRPSMMGCFEILSINQLGPPRGRGPNSIYAGGSYTTY
jgi:hypothetical protein